MRRFRPAVPIRLLVAVLLLIPLHGCALAPRATDRAAAEILWDRYGIPHIFAETDEALFHAYGWAQMENHGELLLRLYGQARGRGAELWGDRPAFGGASTLDTDRWVRTMGTHARGRAAYENAPLEWRRRLDAFARGINEHAARYPDAVAAEVRAVLPVDGADILAHADRVATSWIAGWDVGLAQRWQTEARGSNGWAIAPSKSASGNAMLLANPHLPWADFYTFFEAQLVGPGIDAYGATLLGFPVLAIAFNDHLGWTHTTNTADAADRYELTLAGGGYRFDGAVRPFETRTEVIRVRQADGTLRDDTLVVRHSVHGPVIAVRGDRAVAVRFAATDALVAMQQWWEMGRATSLAQFTEALRPNQVARQNVLYSDRNGNILFFYGGPVPRRPTGDRAFWEALVPGDRAATLWQGTHPFEEIPRLVNPATGWLQNANEGPWWATYPRVLDPAAFPAYMAPPGLGFRPQRSIRMLREADRLTFEQMISLKHSNRMEMADRVLPELLAAAAEHGDADARAAAETLRGWNRAADPDSRGAVVFAAWAQAYPAAAAGRPFAEVWSPERPLDTPHTLASPAAAAAALGDAARQVRQAHGRIDVAWGEVHRYRIDDLDLPGDGGPGGLGIFRAVDFARGTAVGGDSYVAAIEFGTPLRARALIAYGNASRAGSPHRTDQLRYMANGELRPVWRTRAEIEANLSRRTGF
jgi:acyl-homoserine-lactone acylase